MLIRLHHSTIRSFRHEDRTSLATHMNDRAIWRNLRDHVPHPYSVEDAENFIGAVLSSSFPTVFAIDVDGQVVGSVGLHRKTDIYRHSAELGYWVGQLHWGHGIATEVVKAACAWAFANLGVSRIQAEVFAWNVASERVLLKSGFRQEGVLRGAIFKDGEICDAILFGRLNEP